MCTHSSQAYDQSACLLSFPEKISLKHPKDFYIVGTLFRVIACRFKYYTQSSPPIQYVKESVSHSAVDFATYGLQAARFLCPWDFPGGNTGVGYHSLIQGTFPSQGSNLGVLNCRQILYRLSHQRLQRVKEELYVVNHLFELEHRINPWRRERPLTPVFWPRKFRGLYTPWGSKSPT